MVAYRFVLAGFVAAASASAFPAEEELFKSLLKRQEPGTPAYDCHDNCGTAITQSRGDDPCSNEAFLFNYKNCLQCSGPDNYNIWRYYGGTLSGAGSKCGLDTTPLAGKQADVPPANHGGGSGGASSAPPSSTPAPTPSPEPTSGPSEEEPTSGPAGEAPTSGPAPTSSPAPTTGGEPGPTQGSTGGPAPSGTASGYPEEHPSSHPTTSGGVVPSGVPTSSGNGTASFTAGSPPAEQTDNAAAALDMSKAAGVLGAMVFGVVYGF